MPGINQQVSSKGPAISRAVPALQMIEQGTPALAPAVGGAYPAAFRSFGQTDNPGTMFNPYKMRVYLFNNQTVAGFTATKIAFDTVSYDANNAYSSANAAFVAPINGDYVVSGTLLSTPPAGGGGASYMDVRDIDTSTVLAAGPNFNSPANASAGAGVFDVIPLNRGQRVALFFIPGTMAAGNWVIAGGSSVFTYFTIHLLSV